MMDAKALEHRAALKAIVVLARALLPFDLPAMLTAIEQAEAFGCFVDPTLWREKIDDLKFDRELVEAALPLWRMAERLAAAATPPSAAAGPGA